MSEKPETSETRPQGTIVPKVSGFPVTLWNEWDAECKLNFGDCRWMKIWHDHLRAREFENHQILINRIEGLEIKLNALERKQVEKKSDVAKNITFTGTLGGDV